MKTIQYIVLIFSAVCFALPMYAQTGNSQLDREMTLEREYNPSLRDANKINQLPQIKEPEAPKTQVEFSNFLLDYNIPPYLSGLKAKSYFSDYATSNKRGYLVAGISSLLDIDGDLGYHILNSTKDHLGFYYSHRSSNSNVVDVQTDEERKMKINDNAVGADYYHNFDKSRLLADIQYIHSKFNHYGQGEDLYSIPYVNQEDGVNNMLKARLGISSIKDERDPSYLNIYFTHINQRQTPQSDNKRIENMIGGDFDINRLLDNETQPGIGGYVKRYMYKNFPDESGGYFRKYNKEYHYTIVSLTPHLTLYRDTWDLRIGVFAGLSLGATANIFDNWDDTKFTFAPDVKFHWRPSEPYLFYLYAEGGITDNSNYNMFFDNRYVIPEVRIADSYSPFDGTVGFKVSPLPELSINLFSGYKLSKNEHFLINKVINWFSSSPSLGMWLKPHYMQAEIFKLGGSVQYSFQKMIDLSLEMTYLNWDVKNNNKDYFGLGNEALYIGNNNKAWSKPSFVTDANVGIKLPTVPLRIDLNYHLETGRTGVCVHDGEGLFVKMKNIHDLNAKVNYTINDSFSVFAQTNNLLFQKYDIWYGYPAQKFNIMGGLSVKF